MQYRRPLTWMTLLMVFVLVLAGCAPRVGGGEAAKSAAADQLVVDLPAIALDVADDGSLALGGLPLGAYGAAFGMDPAVIEGVLSSATLTPDQVAMLKAAGVQHIQLSTSPSGLAIFVNGQQMPSIAWNGEQLAEVGKMAGFMPSLSTLLPLIQSLGIGVVLRLPVAEGAAAIPLNAAVEDPAAAALAAKQQEFVDSVGTGAIAALPLVFDANGGYTINGLSVDQLIAATGQSIWKSLEHTAKQMDFVKRSGIKSLAAEIAPDGLHLTVNDVALPVVDWSGGKLATVIELVKKTGLLDSAGIDPAQLDSILNSWLPALTASDIKIVALYPAE